MQWRPVDVGEMKHLDLHGERVAYRDAGTGETLLQGRQRIRNLIPCDAVSHPTTVLTTTLTTVAASTTPPTRHFADYSCLVTASAWSWQCGGHGLKH
jgi:hypothetical protein